jgi:two-component system response regulator MprA
LTPDNPPRQILVVDDDPRVLSMLRRGLTLEGFDVATAEGGRAALDHLHSATPDLVVLDVMMPGVDGFELCRRIRKTGETGILMLTARDAVPDRVTGLEAGADDYLAKPFAFEELVARIRAVLRRKVTEQGDQTLLQFEDVALDLRRREARRGEVALTLTTREFDLLAFFIRNAGHVVTREQIFERVWGGDFSSESNVIEVHVANVREKLEVNGGRRLIQTVRGAGYALR